MIALYLMIIFILMLIYLGKNKTLEYFYSEGVIISDPEKLNETTKELNEKQQMKVSDSFKNAKYFTNNKINYDLLDNNIDLLLQQYNNLNYNFENFKIGIKKVTTTNNPKEDPTIQIGGSYPSNIQMFLTFPPPLPGKTGEKGETGDEGPKGKDGKKGAKGKSGPFGQCPK